MTDRAPGKMRAALAAVGAMAIAAGVLGCGAGQEETKKQPGKPLKGRDERVKIGFCMTLDHPYWQNMRIGAIDEGKKLNAEVTIMNAEEDATKQIQQIKELIARGVDILCVVPMKRDALVPGIREANRKGIPVVIVNREIGEGCDYVCYTGTSTYEGAVTSAKILMEAIGSKGEIVEFHQHLGSGPEIARTKALRDVLKDHPGVKVMARIGHKGSRARTTKEMQTLLSDPDKAKRIAGVYAHGDNFGIAAAKACVQAGRKDIKIVGMGGSQEAIDAIKAGLLTGTSFQRPEEEGRSAIRLACGYLRKAYMIPCPPITKDNAHKFKGQF